MIIDRIYELLTEKNKKASELCKALGIQQSTMSTWKTNHRDPPAKDMKTIADFLGVSLDLLLTGEDAPAPRYTTQQEDDLLDLFRMLPEGKRYEFIGELKGFIRANADSIKYEDIGKNESA